MIEQVINIDRLEHTFALFGSFDANIRIIEQEFLVSVVNRENEIKVAGEAENVMIACRAIDGLLNLLSKGETITEQNLRYVISLVQEGNEEQIGSLADEDNI